MKERSLTSRAALLAVVLACTAGACTETVSTHNAASNLASSSQTSKGSTVPVARLEKAIAATKSVSSGQFVVDSETDVGADFNIGTESESEPTTTIKNDFMTKHRSPGSPDTGTKGVFDRDQGRARIDNHGSDITAIVVDGDQYYLKLQKPQDPATPWQEVSADQYNSMSPGIVDFTDPMDVLQNVKFVGSTAAVVGTDQLDGTPTVHYEAHMNLSALNAARRKPNSSSHMTIVKMQSPEADNIPVDLWVDKAGRVVRIWFASSYDETMTYRVTSDSAQAKPKTSTSHIGLAFDLSLTHLDEPVSISVPTPSQVAPPVTGDVMPGSPGH